jgi:F-type H+-transporting ATPase subunit epsilon
MAEMTVDLVAVERKMWSGQASYVGARTTEGEIGIMPGHAPTLAQLDHAAVVRVDGTDGSRTMLAVHGGFLHVTADGVTVLAEFAELAEEIDVSRAREALRRAEGAGEDGQAAAERANVRLRAAGAAE